MRRTKSMASMNPSNLKVRKMVFARCDQSGTAFKFRLICLAFKAGINKLLFLLAVSYTHLDVYKRQRGHNGEAVGG